MKVSIRPVQLSDYRYDIQVMLAEHSAEVTRVNRLREVNVNFDAYLEFESAGRLFLLGVFYEEYLVGYAAMTIMPHPHAQHVIVCASDSIFLRKEFRAGRNGVKLIQAIREEAKARGAGILMVGAKIGSALDRLLPSLGFSRDEVAYTMEF